MGLDDVGHTDGVGWIRVQLHAVHPGRLPGSLPTDLPAGELVPVGGRPLAWFTPDGSPKHWYAGVRAFPTTGLWPLTVADAAGRPLPQSDGAAGRPGPEVPVSDAEEVLRRPFDVAAELGAEEPWQSSWLGLAPEEPDPRPTVAVHPPAGRHGLLLVPALRPAESLERLGWLGATDYGLTGADLTAVLASWEDRFGAVLTTVGDDLIRLSVARPVRTRAAADRLAREHYAFCPEVLDGPEAPAAAGIEAYAEQLLGRHEWRFWWLVDEDAEA